VQETSTERMSGTGDVMSSGDGASTGDATHAATGSSGGGGKREQSAQSLSLSASSTLSASWPWPKVIGLLMTSHSPRHADTLAPVFA